MAGRQASRQAGGWVGGRAGGRAGRQAGRLTDQIQVDFNILKILYKYVKLFGFLFCVICHCNVTIALEVHLSQLLSIKLIIRHVLKCEKKLAFFHVNPYYLVLAYLII